MNSCRAPKTIVVFLLLTALLLGYGTPAGAIDSYLTISRHNVNIRSAPTKKARVVASARKGDRFKFIQQVGDWYEIRMFSGDNRYIYRKLGQITINNSVANLEEETVEKLHNEIVRAEERARREAAARFPGNANQSSRYERFALDRYTLEVFRNHGVTPAAYEQIIRKAVSQP